MRLAPRNPELNVSYSIQQRDGFLFQAARETDITEIELHALSLLAAEVGAAAGSGGAGEWGNGGRGCSEVCVRRFGVDWRCA